MKVVIHAISVTALKSPYSCTVVQSFGNQQADYRHCLGKIVSSNKGLGQALRGHEDENRHLNKLLKDKGEDDVLLAKWLQRSQRTDLA